MASEKRTITIPIDPIRALPDALSEALIDAIRVVSGHAKGKYTEQEIAQSLLDTMRAKIEKDLSIRLK